MGRGGQEEIRKGHMASEKPFVAGAQKELSKAV